MHIRLVEVENFRGVKTLRWSPREGVNCLIGPGDSTKTTVLDAIELALSPRSYSFADDSDFYDLDTDQPVRITVTIGDLPLEFLAEAKYGLHTRGWDAQASVVIDEPGNGFEEVLSIRVEIDKALEARWSLFNDRLEARESDPPMIRYKDMQRITSSRLGPFASRHFTWGRGSVLGQLDEEKESVSLELAEAGRAARAAFKKGDRAVFSATAKRVEKFSKHFSVPVRSGYRADLDVESVSVNSGGISLHDGNLPLRRLGSGSARLLVSALQGEAAADAHVALIDEIEHGLEPHRIARLAQYLRGKGLQPEASVPGQIFATTHSPVVVREFSAEDLFVVRCENGETVVRSIPVALQDTDKAQALTRRAPEAFLARRVLIGEGKTEAGLLRGLDDWWIAEDKLSCAYLGICVIEGGGKDHAPAAGVALRALGYDVALLLDSDEPPNEEYLREFDTLNGRLIQWEGDCSTEERVFIDVPWVTVRALVSYAAAASNEDSVLAHIRNACASLSLPPPPDLTLPVSLDTKEFRRALGRAAKKKEAAWFKDIDRGKELAGIIAPVLAKIYDTPFAAGINKLRQWIDAAPTEDEIAFAAASARRASIVAAAGCGKTEQIALATKASAGRRLILTHTHAGVDALKARMEKCGVPPTKYRIETIASWSLRYAAAFPLRSGLKTTEPEGEEWNEVYASAARLLGSGAVRAVIDASYDGLFVDEYQDCTLPQHVLVSALSDHLPTCLFGDPMQAIFDFKDQVPVGWTEHVFPAFPLAGKLTTPWRWTLQDNHDLACWLHGAREALEEGRPLNLHGRPACVTWKHLPPDLKTDTSRNERMSAIVSACKSAQVNEGETLVVIGDSARAKSRSHLAKLLSKMHFSVIEPVQCADLVKHARLIDAAEEAERLAALLDFAAACMTGAGKAVLLNAVASRKSGGRAGKKFGALIDHCLAAEEPGNHEARRAVLLGLYDREGTYAFRREMLFALCAAIRLVATGQCQELEEAVWQIQNRIRHGGRRIRKRNIGSTLLVKGLEFDHAVIADADALKRKDLYVAITRPIQTLTILSADPDISPKS